MCQSHQCGVNPMTRPGRYIADKSVDGLEGMLPVASFRLHLPEGPENVSVKKLPVSLGRKMMK